MGKLTKNQNHLSDSNQSGFIPMMILLLLIVGAIIYFAYIRVHNAQG